MRARSMFRSFSLPLTGPKNSEGSKVNIPATIYNSEEEDTDKLTEFKQIAKCLNVPSSADDYFYMKWLRARGYDMEKAKEMLNDHLEWRENCTYLHGIMNYIAPKDVLEQLRWKRVGNDPEGRPVYVILVGQVDVKSLLDNNYLEDVKRYLHKFLEYIQGDSDEQRKLTGYGKFIGIIDMNGFTFSKAMNIDLIQLGIYFARIFEANYPESLYRAYIINSSWFFTSVYNAVKPFLSHETITKIQIHGYDQSSYLPALEETVPLEILPEEYGGTGDSIELFEQIP